MESGPVLPEVDNVARFKANQSLNSGFIPVWLQPVIDPITSVAMMILKRLIAQIY